MITGQLNGTLFESIFEARKSDTCFFQISRCNRNFKDMFKVGDIGLWQYDSSKNIDDFKIIEKIRDVF